jgi:NAD(P)-dependent dehydrogenase (short-subunit alcohol dehydrogenase family)
MAESTTVVVGGDRGIGHDLAGELAHRGRTVEVVSGAATDLCEPDAVAAELRRAGAGAPVTTVVVAHVEAAALVEVALAEMGEQAWEAATERTLRAGVVVLQQVHAVVPDGARVVLVLPTVAAAGVAGLVPLCTAVEGLRVMAKALARRWGARGITVNTVEVPLAAFVLGAAEAGTERAADVPAVPVLSEPALPARSAVDDVAGLVELLDSDAGGALTGALLVADRGTVLQP